jgi:hypothetical protein
VLAHEWLSPGGYTALPMRLRTRMRFVFMGADHKGRCLLLSTIFPVPPDATAVVARIAGKQVQFDALP